ncbi:MULTISPECIES: hypothetical protein [Methanosarcina]|jgi:hypothetical protein|uniref:Uncharacterized protein n=2 Tax=Methanosarcina mazei TaxID=2209 RepID=A0A0E3LEW5_METMZ|nr:MULTISPECIES: hypothetical protein [Methanosarcina]AKB39731.1 hypothetical protein MSMAW_0740 [Methanosarcina mazei WWM610]KKH56370.1 hypothetical protein DU74_10980 [Methanosarcina mazei]
MDDMELVFERTCNYWIDVGIVGFYDSLNKPVSLPDSTGGWSQTIKKYSGIEATLYPDKLVIKGSEKQIDLALSHALEKVRTTLYDVSSEDQIANPVEDGRVKKQSTLAGEVVASGKGKQASGNTYFREEINEEIGKKNIFLPLKPKKIPTSNCIFCGQLIDTGLFLGKNANDVFIGDTSKSSPFVEGESSNKCFHSSHKVSEKCWKCGYVTFFAPLLLFYKSNVSGGKGDTYYALPYIPGNLQATYKLYRNLSGKRGLARVLGTDHKNMNYESFFPSVPKGISSFSLSFYFDLYEKLLPKNVGGLFQSSKNIGLIDDYGTVFQTALFLKRDSGKKSFIISETTIDKSAYFIKLFAHIKKEFELTKGGDLLSGVRSFIGKADSKSNYLQKTSVLKASHAITEGKHVHRFLLPLLSSNLKTGNADSYSAFQILMLFQKYDQWLFLKENVTMANIVEQAKNSGWFLSQDFWAKKEWDDDEKENLLKRYYYRIERSPSPVGFLEQVRHAYKKVSKEIPKEMIFHKEDGTEDIKVFEVYRVYFLAGMLNGLISGTKRDAINQAGESDGEVVTNGN